MKKLKIIKMIGFILLSLTMFSCDNELHMTLPEGPQGNDGLSAYEVWVKGVENGKISWAKDRTDVNNFFLYLKGEDGKDGTGGQSGTNGKSAYELWKDEVAKGLTDPHNQTQNWAKDKTSINDFWYYLTGAKGQTGSTPTIGTNGNWFIDETDTGVPAKGQDGTGGTNGSTPMIGANGNWFINGTDTGIPAFGEDGTSGTNGKSAYELWVEEVAKGIEDPHNSDQEWPKDKTTTQDFWAFLRGGDGLDGKDGNPGETGEPGKDVVIVKGKPNVVSQYVAQEFNEFVRWTDGGVAFIVYDDQGGIASGAKVKGLPGVQDPNKVYVADASGSFVVPKEDLPTDKSVSERFGVTSEVEYVKSTGEIVKESSAKNTYVPSRMQVRVMVVQNPYLQYSQLNYKFFYVDVERKTDANTEWKKIPTYLGNLSQKIITYELSDPINPISYTETSNIFSSTTINISSTSTSTSKYIYIPRLNKTSKYIKNPSNLWDGGDHYFNVVLDSYYGEKPHANIVMKMAPVQYMPFVKNVKAYNYNSTLKIFSKIEGEFDIADANIDYNLLFKSNLTKEEKTIGGNTFDYYYPEVENKAKMDIAKLFQIEFFVDENSANNTNNRATIPNPNFTVYTPYIGSKVYISVSNLYFADLSSRYSIMGTLDFVTEGGVQVLKIVGVKNSNYDFPDITVQQITE